MLKKAVNDWKKGPDFVFAVTLTIPTFAATN